MLLHDEDHGEALIDAWRASATAARERAAGARQRGHAGRAERRSPPSFAYGAAGVRLLVRARPKHDSPGSRTRRRDRQRRPAGLGFGAGVGVIETDDPDQLRAALDGTPLATPAAQPRPSCRTAPSAACWSSPSASCTAPPPPRRRGAAAGRRPVRRARSSMPRPARSALACVGACPTGRALRQSRPADAPLHGIVMRAMRPVRRTCPEDADHRARAAARLPRPGTRRARCSRKRSRSPARPAASRSGRGPASSGRGQASDGHWMFSGATRPRRACAS